MKGVLALLAMLLVSVIDVRAAAPADKTFHIYAVTYRGDTDIEKGFKNYLTSKGIKYRVTTRNLDRDVSKFPAIIEEIKQSKPDLLFLWGTTVTLGVIGRYDEPSTSKFVTGIPVVFTLVAEPIDAKIIPPKGSRPDVTGVRFLASVEEQFRAMRDYQPFTKIGIIYTPTEENSVLTLKRVHQIAKSWNFQVVVKPFRRVGENKVTADGAEDMVRELKEAGCEWLYLPPDSHLNTRTKQQILPAAMAVGLPSFASTEQLMKDGATAGLLSRYFAVGQYTGYKMEQILVQGKRADEIPVDPLKKFSLQVRMDAAHKLHFRPPLTMLSYAELVNDGELDPRKRLNTEYTP